MSIFHFHNPLSGYPIKGKFVNVAIAAWNDLLDRIGVETRASDKVFHAIFMFPPYE